MTSNANSLRSATAPATSSPDQRAAIEHDRGPCLVVAAPGSGKTWVITQRFTRLVRSGVSPERILCLTFNRRAADEMLGRVEREVGPLSGEPPPLTTYNAWAAALLRDFGASQDAKGRGLSIASGAEQWLFLAEAIEEVAPPSLYNPARPYDSVAAINKVIQRAKQELVTPQQYLSYAKKLLKQAGPAEREDAQRQVDIASVYEVLQRKYSEAGLLDHDDCIRFAAERIKNSPAVRQAVKQYDYIMVDEYQDTNTAQAAMVEAMVGVAGNVMVVADDDQAIYRFRGASRENIRRFRAHFPTRQELPLLENRRSTPDIVSISQQVIESASSREAKTATAIRPAGARVKVIAADHYNDEAMSIVTTIREKLAAGASYRDIAILFRNHGDMDAVILALRSADIPYVSRGGNDFFRAPEVMGVVRTMEAVANPEEDQAVLSCLKFPAWGMSNAGRYRAVSFLAKNDVRLIDALVDGVIPGLSDEDLTAGRIVGEQIRDLNLIAQTADVGEVFEQAMLLSGNFGVGMLTRDVERQQFTRNIARMREILREFSTVRSTKLSDAVARNGQLAEAVKYLRIMRDSNSEGTVPLSDEIDGVRLSTIHGAKGLEWPHVIVAAAVDGKLPGRRRPDAIELPADFLSYEVDPVTAHMDEELHLFYVASTRARDSLTYTWAKHYPGNKDTTVRKPSRFLGLIDPSLLDHEVAPASQLMPAKQRAFPIQQSPPPLNVSFSSLQAFKACERQYEYRSIWGVPQMASPDARFGTLIHSVLCDAMRLREQGTAVNTAFVLKLWETKWRTEGAELTKQRPTLYQRGVTMLRQYVGSDSFQKASIWMYQAHDDQGQPQGNPKPMLEFPFKIDVGNNVALVGRFDRVDNRDGKPVVVDYKTGKPRSLEALQRDDQLKLYANAVSDLLGVDEVVCQIHWLQNGTVGEVTFTKKQLDTARSSTLDWCQKIRQQHFSGRTLVPNPNSWNCGTCPYRVVCDQGRDLLGDSLGL